MTSDRLPGLIGLAKRAGMMVFGADSVLKAVRRREAVCVLIDESASANTLKRLRDAGAYYRVRCAVLPEDMLDRACGLSGGKTAALLKGSLSDEIIRLLQTKRIDIMEGGY